MREYVKVYRKGVRTFGIMLGNKTISDIEHDHGLEFTDEEREFLGVNWHPVATFYDGESGWHMFDSPPFLYISNGEIGRKCLDIFKAHNSDYKFHIRVGYANREEQNDERTD